MYSGAKVKKEKPTKFSISLRNNVYSNNNIFYIILLKTYDNHIQL
jgi:hypothetical protein